MTAQTTRRPCERLEREKKRSPTEHTHTQAFALKAQRKSKGNSENGKNKHQTWRRKKTRHIYCEWSILGVFALHIYEIWAVFFFASPAQTINLISCCVCIWSICFLESLQRHFSRFVLLFFRYIFAHPFSFSPSLCRSVAHSFATDVPLKVCHIIFCLLSSTSSTPLHSLSLSSACTPVQTKSIFSLWNISFRFACWPFKVLHILNGDSIKSNQNKSSQPTPKRRIPTRFVNRRHFRMHAVSLGVILIEYRSTESLSSKIKWKRLHSNSMPKKQQLQFKCSLNIYKTVGMN